MKLQKSRLMALLSVALMVCMMVTMMAIPASAAGFESVEVLYDSNASWSFLVPNVLYVMCPDYDIESHSLAVNMEQIISELDMNFPPMAYFDSERGMVILKYDAFERIISMHNTLLPDHAALSVPADVCEYREASSGALYYGFHSPASAGDYEGCEVATLRLAIPDNTVSTTGTSLSDVVSSDMLTGVLSELINLLPIVIPVLIGFIGLRKGISFLQSVLHSA